MKKRSVIINGHATSVSMEQEFWDVLKKIAESKNISINHIVSDVDEARSNHNLSSALRVFVLEALLKN